MNRRLLQFLAAENISQAAFADKINVARASVSHILKGRNKPGYDFFEGIIRNYPSLNLEWLLTGKGKMYKFDDQQDDSVISVPESRISAENDLFSIPDDSQRMPDVTGSRQEIYENAHAEDENTCFSEQSNDEAGGTFADRQRKAVRIIVFYDNGTFEEFSR